MAGAATGSCGRIRCASSHQTWGRTLFYVQNHLLRRQFYKEAFKAEKHCDPTVAPPARVDPKGVIHDSLWVKEVRLNPRLRPEEEIDRSAARFEIPFPVRSK